MKPCRLLHSTFVVITLATFSSLQADELDDVMGGFDDMGSAATIETTDDSDTKIAGELTGSIALSTAYNWNNHHSSNPSLPSNSTDWEGLSKFKTRLNLEYNTSIAENWEARIAGYAFYDSVYQLRDRDRYSNDVINSYEYEAEFQEVWVRSRLRDNLDIRIGRQVVNWGRADSLRVLDVLNPLDNREPGLADIEDLRLPVTMIKTDYFIDSHWQTSFIIIPEVRFSKNPPLGSDFEVVGSNFKENEPEDIADTSYAGSVYGIFSGWDISFHAARYWRDTPYLDPVFSPTPTPLAGSTLEHSRLTMVGTGGNYTQGAWLYKAELAWLDGVNYTTSSFVPLFGVLPTGTTEKNRLDSLIGIEYFGIANTSFSVEIAHQYIPDFKENMKAANEDKNLTALALRATHSMLNDRLDLTAVVFGNYGEAGGGARFDSEYDLRDALVLKTGIIMYYKGDDPPFDTYDANDRVFAELKYSF